MTVTVLFDRVQVIVPPCLTSPQWSRRGSRVSAFAVQCRTDYAPPLLPLRVALPCPGHSARDSARFRSRCCCTTSFPCWDSVAAVAVPLDDVHRDPPPLNVSHTRQQHCCYNSNDTHQPNGRGEGRHDGGDNSGNSPASDRSLFPLGARSGSITADSAL